MIIFLRTQAFTVTVTVFSYPPTKMASNTVQSFSSRPMFTSSASEATSVEYDIQVGTDKRRFQSPITLAVFVQVQV